ncbi:MAG: hypothetical protein KTR14_00795 [Vampirovibrio sp.]|nr:hypothetical protein [Vampirovibrio sp.]
MDGNNSQGMSYAEMRRQQRYQQGLAQAATSFQVMTGESVDPETFAEAIAAAEAMPSSSKIAFSGGPNTRQQQVQLDQEIMGLITQRNAAAASTESDVESTTEETPEESLEETPDFEAEILTLLIKKELNQERIYQVYKASRNFMHGFAMQLLNRDDKPVDVGPVDNSGYYQALGYE